jgi:hypothetical protein
LPKESAVSLHDLLSLISFKYNAREPMTFRYLSAKGQIDLAS